VAPDRRRRPIPPARDPCSGAGDGFPRILTVFRWEGAAGGTSASIAGPELRPGNPLDIGLLTPAVPDRCNPARGLLSSGRPAAMPVRVERFGVRARRLRGRQAGCAPGCGGRGVTPAASSGSEAVNDPPEDAAGSPGGSGEAHAMPRLDMEFFRAAPRWRELSLLTEIERHPHLTQNELGRRLGIPACLVNAHLRELTKKGWLRAEPRERSRGRLRTLTIEGTLHRGFLRYRFLQEMMDIENLVQAVLGSEVDQLAQAGIRALRTIGPAQAHDALRQACRDACVDLQANIDPDQAALAEDEEADACVAYLVTTRELRKPILDAVAALQERGRRVLWL